jgi:hypothetical protein
VCNVCACLPVCVSNYYLHNLYNNSRDEPTFDQQLETFDQQLEDGYCSVIVVNYELIMLAGFVTKNIFVAQSCTHR